MSFSKEDRKKVFEFFEKLLFANKTPIYYEHLRGHVSKAEHIVKKYIRKECKGENFLRYFEKRKNYFVVDFRGEVSLRKSRENVLTVSELNELYESDDINSAEENNGSEYSFSYDTDTAEGYSNSEYSTSSVHSRSNSTTPSSLYKTPLSSVNGDDSSEIGDLSQEKTDLERISITYFNDLLGKSKKINVNILEIKNLPYKVQCYMRKYMKKKIVLFFKHYPEIFHINERNYVSLVNPPMKKTSHEFFQKRESPKVERNESPVQPEEEAEDIKNFLQCAEFFVNILKKKNNIPLKNLSGSLSNAPPGVLKYLKLNYPSFKHFLLEADKLFNLNGSEEIFLTKDCSKLLKDGKKLSGLKSGIEFSSLSFKNKIKSLFQSKYAIRSPSETDDIHKLGMPDMNVLNEDVFHCTNDIASEREKFESSQNEDFRKLKLFSDKSADFVKSEKEIQDKSVSEDVKSLDVLLNKCKNEQRNVLNNEKQKSRSLDIIAEIFEDSLNCNTPTSGKVKKYTRRSFIECAFIVQLLCLEVIEKEYNLCLSFEYEAVKFFVEILEKLPNRSCDFTSLKGCLGQASCDVIFFMKQLYKGEKIKSFFLKHDEFVLNSHSLLIRLSSSYKKYLEEKEKLHKAVIGEKKMYSVHNLYDYHLHEVFVDVFDCFSKFCCFLQNKSKTKLNRLDGIFSKFSAPQQKLINSLSGSVVSKKLKNFLCCFTIFDFLDEFIQINPELDVLLLVSSISKFSEKLNMLKQFDKSKLPCFDHLLDYLMAYEDEIILLDADDLRNRVFTPVQIFLSHNLPLDYSELPKVVGHKVLLSLVSEKENSQSIIKLLEESGLFELKNGQVFQKIKDLKEIELVDENALSQNDFESGSLQQSDVKLNDNISDNVDSLESKCLKVSPCNKKFMEEEIQENNLNSENNTMDIMMSSISNGKMNSICDELQTSNREDNNKASALFELPNLDLGLNILMSCDVTSSALKFDDNENAKFSHNEFNSKESLIKHEFLNMQENTPETNSTEMNLTIELSEELEKSMVHTNVTNEVISHELEKSRSHTVANEVNSEKELLKKNSDELEKSMSHTVANEVNSEEDLLEKLLCRESDDAGLINSFKYPVFEVFTDDSTSDFLQQWYNNNVSSLKNEGFDDAGINYVESLSSSADFEIHKTKENFSIHKIPELNIDDVKISKCNSENNLGGRSFMNAQKSCKRNTTFEEQSLENQAADLKISADEMDNSKMNELTVPSFNEKNKEKVDNNEVTESSYSLSTFKGNFPGSKTLNKSVQEVVKDSSFPVDNEEDSCNIIFINESSKSSHVLSEVTAEDKEFSKDYNKKEFIYENLKPKMQLSDNSLGGTCQLVCPENIIPSSADIAKDKNSSNEKHPEISVKSTISSSKEKFIHHEMHASRINDVSNSESVKAESTKQNNRNECHEKLKTNPDLFSRDQNLSEFSKMKDSNNESYSSDVPHQNDNVLFLQPLQAKIILSTLDSCIVETVIKGLKKYVFCLKSCFHCEQHTDCLECFDSLIVGDTVSCYVQPSEDFNYANMCFAFMFCKDMKANGKKSKFPLISPSKHFHEKFKPKTLVKKVLSDEDYMHKSRNFEFSMNPDCKSVHSAIGECQTILSGEVKLCSHIVEKECQANCSTVSQNTQTVQSAEMKCCGIEKGCQIEYPTVSQGTQTYNNSSESGCQTLLAGKVKPCPPVVEKACLIKFPTFSQSSQTVCKSIERPCQTSVSGSIKSCFDTSSSECQTTLSGEVQKSVNLVNKSCQILPLFNLVNITTQTFEHDVACDKETPKSFAVDDLSPNVNITAHNKHSRATESFKDIQDSACQTISTGAILIKRYYL